MGGKGVEGGLVSQGFGGDGVVAGFVDGAVDAGAGKQDAQERDEMLRGGVAQERELELAAGGIG